MISQQDSTDGGLDTCANISPNIAELKDALDTLVKALKENEDKATDVVFKAVLKVRESGAQKLKSASQAEEGYGEMTHLYNRIINRLQTAADKGNVEATELLDEIYP